MVEYYVWVELGNNKGVLVVGDLEYCRKVVSLINDGELPADCWIEDDIGRLVD